MAGNQQQVICKVVTKCWVMRLACLIHDMSDNFYLHQLDLNRLLTSVYAHATHMKSRIHGESHWLHVTKAGLELARQIPDCDVAVIFLFGLLHDTQRLTDGHDPQHGERASYFAQHCQQAGLLNLSDDQLKKLAYACHEHNNPLVSDDPAIGICWDADRLNLWRVKIIPTPKFLSTVPAKTWSMRIKACMNLLQSYTWQGLLTDYIALERERR